MSKSEEQLKKEFVHCLTNTLLLLGGDNDLVALLRETEEKPITPDIINTIRCFNTQVLDGLRLRINDYPAFSVQVT